MLLVCAACSSEKPSPVAKAEPAPAAERAPAAPEPLPPSAPTEPIGEPGPFELIATDDAGVWQVVCSGTPYDQGRKMRVAVGGGPGFEAGSLVAAAAQDLLVHTDDGLIHVDVLARTTLRLHRATGGAIDPDTRRVVVAIGKELEIRDPGKAPRRVPLGGQVAAIVLRAARWAQVWLGEPPKLLDTGCHDARPHHSYEEPAIVDLDPSGVEAVDRVGPEIGVTPTGDITLSGEVVIAAECVGAVSAALADPPRVLAICRDGRIMLGQPGAAARELGRATSFEAESAQISQHLSLGERVVCLYGGCVDLLDGRHFPTWSQELVIYTKTRIVRRDPSLLLVDDLDADTQTTITLPQIAQSVTVDAVTGRRKVGAPPPAALEAIDLSGDYLLYGRFVVDIAGARVTRILDADAVAVDRLGRALVPASPGQGPLRWIGP